jgi:hypothetical protein
MHPPASSARLHPAMERTRAVSPAPSNESALPELAAQEPGPKALPLRELVETVRSPGVMREDVEALLAGLSAPLAEGESPRERADQLLQLLQDEALGELTDQEGRQVRPEALEALLALGYPYAFEVPPEVLSRMNRSSARALSRSARWGLGLAAFAAVLPSVAVALFSRRGWWDSSEGLTLLGGVMLLPAILSAVAERYRLRWLKYFGNSGLVLLSAGSLFVAWAWSHGPAEWKGLSSLGVGLALLGSAFCLRHRKDPEDLDP